MATLSRLPALAGTDNPLADRRVRIAVLVVRPGDQAAVELDGPVRSAVRSAFAHPRLAASLKAVQMDADRLVGRIVARWQEPGRERETSQQWTKSDGETTVRWWVERRAA